MSRSRDTGDLRIEAGRFCRGEIQLAQSLSDGIEPDPSQKPIGNFVGEEKPAFGVVPLHSHERRVANHCGEALLTLSKSFDARFESREEPSALLLGPVPCNRHGGQVGCYADPLTFGFLWPSSDGVVRGRMRCL